MRKTLNEQLPLIEILLPRGEFDLSRLKRLVNGLHETILLFFCPDKLDCLRDARLDSIAWRVPLANTLPLPAPHSTSDILVRPSLILEVSKDLRMDA
jgi:hypothetical protein